MPGAEGADMLAAAAAELSSRAASMLTKYRRSMGRRRAGRWQREPIGSAVAVDRTLSTGVVDARLAASLERTVAQHAVLVSAVSWVCAHCVMATVIGTTFTCSKAPIGRRSADSMCRIDSVVGIDAFAKHSGQRHGRQKRAGTAATTRTCDVIASSCRDSCLSGASQFVCVLTIACICRCVASVGINTMPYLLLPGSQRMSSRCSSVRQRS